MEKTLAYHQHQVKYFEEGQGPTLMLLHGWPTNSRLWRAQVEVLKATHRVITFDWLGFGQSDKPSDHAYTFSHKRDILAALIEETCTTNEALTLVAHDLGGPPAILWASEHAQRVTNLVLLNTVLFPFSTPLDQISHLTFRVPGLSHWLLGMAGLERLMNNLTESRGEAIEGRIREVLSWHVAWTHPLKVKTILTPVEHGKNHETPSLLNRLTALRDRLHLVIAQQDPLCYAHMKKLQEHLPEVPATILERCGHFIPLDRPHALNEVLLKMG